MMWSTIANFKENLNQIAFEVPVAAEEHEIYPSVAGEDLSVSDRRVSHRFAQSKSPLRSPIANGDSSFKTEIEQFKAEIQRLQESETEFKALSVNYAALLKQKEERLSTLHEENGSLRQNLEATNVLKGTIDQSPSRQHRLTTQVYTHSTGNHKYKGIVSKQDALSNGSVQAIQSDGIQRKMEPELANLQGNEKELADLLEENRSLAAMQSSYQSGIKQLRTELDKERDNLANIQLKLQEEHKLNGSFQKELRTLKMDKDKNSKEMKELSNDLNEKISEIRRLQLELTRRDNEEEAYETTESLKREIATLERENFNLKMEKGELEAALKMSANSSHVKICADDSDPKNKHSSNLYEVHSSGKFSGKEEMELSLQKFENDLKEACRERNKALQELTRIKQHLLDKELEESDKMDEDRQVIEELQANYDYQRAQILRLEKALKQAIATQEDVKNINSSELQKSKEIINDLKKKLASCTSTIDAKNVELSNLQTALGQYYAETEAKERLERDLALAREESAKLSELLKDANQRVEISKREKGEIVTKLSQAERMLSEGKQTRCKLEEDNAKLRRALEHSMTRLNRMSVDSDYFVDRRIVIKLLVTYFQRNHSKEKKESRVSFQDMKRANSGGLPVHAHEMITKSGDHQVLDLMVRMLGFSEEDKQRIGVAQQGAGKGVVRGVLGLPGRLVGGILGGSSREVTAHMPSENQSFADLWVDFLLKETEERERRESMEATGGSKIDAQGRSMGTRWDAAPMSDHRTNMSSATCSIPRINPLANQNTNSHSSRGNLQQQDH